ncbi:ketopantoate reductase family protein [Amycolatopsis pigmentata]|uniref:2-dehydropantoate 2-reductase n=1 Tax=Amycolatopsis pigmentata TaxID=450801 RepID=A0ABW5FS74_9PSEU
MKVLVYGAGGIGLYFSAVLAAAGADVTLIGRSGTVSAARTSPLVLTRHGRSERVDGVTVVDAPDGLSAPDLVIVAVKSWQVRTAAEELVKVVGPETVVLPMQNGVDAPGILAARLGLQPVLGCACVVISKRTGPLDVTCVGADAALEIGALDPDTRPGSPRVTAVRELLESAGVRVTWSDNIQVTLWKKLMLIASYGGIGALSRSPVGVTSGTPELAELVERAMLEVAAVARARGVPVEEHHIDGAMRTFRSFAPDTTASMQRDLAEGRPSELADQSGAVVRYGRESGVDTPVHACVYAACLPAERSAREKEG